MKRIFKFSLLGGLIGAGFSAVRSYRNDESIDTLANKAAKSGAAGAAAGAVTGAALSVRASVMASRKITFTEKVGSAIGWAELMKIASPIIEHGVDAAMSAAKPKAEKVSKVAKDGKVRMGDLITSAKPRAEQIIDLTDAARPTVEKVVSEGSKKAREIIDLTRERLVSSNGSKAS